MNRSRLIWFAIVPLFIISGCLPKPGSGSWVKDDISRQQLRDDYEECNRPTEPIYIKDGVGKEERENDLMTCKAEAATRKVHVEAATEILKLGTAIPFWGIPIGVVGLIVASANISDYSQRCMKQKGYPKVDPKKRKWGRAEINACMREKGYEWK
ncbi:MAG: hypothetical protein A2157_13000 [Deltaproteobacteria bacterium RBG_16_47_11]|nr:MAG: hypothetical protein A2157_13000 [Deltaproteobacteria bacterium RBG_16_47_11]